MHHSPTSQSCTYSSGPDSDHEMGEAVAKRRAAAVSPVPAPPLPNHPIDQRAVRTGRNAVDRVEGTHDRPGLAVLETRLEDREVALPHVA